MAKLKNFLYCLNINTTDGSTNITGLMSAFSPEYIPGLFSFFVGFTLLNLTEGEHLVTINFINPDKDIIASINDVNINYKKESACNLPEEYMGVNIAAGFQNVDFKKSGLYFTQVLLDGNDMGKFEIFVKGKNE